MATPQSTHLCSPIEDLSLVFVARLREALAPSRVLFDRQRDGDSWRPSRGSERLTGTAIALIGLSRAGIAPGRVGLDPRRTLDALIERMARARHPGPLGLVLWAASAWGEPLGSGPLERWTRGDGGLTSIARRLRTMELAWLVSGLAHRQHVDSSVGTRLALDLATTALLGRFELASRTFWHAEVDSPWPLRVRRRVATFADQIYPIQALAQAAIVAGTARALDVASAAALRLAEVQGGLGQWWWHHDPVDGKVVGSYPVYSVHQHGMAPMAFRTLALAGGPDLSGSVRAGRSWLVDNELGVGLVDRRAGTIWRSIVRDESTPRQLVRHARRLAGPAVDDRVAKSPPRLRVNRETRPYEWAWYLFASAVEGGSPLSGHLA